MYVPGPPYQRRLRAVRTRGAGPLAPRLPTRCVWPCAWPCASGAPATRRAPGPLAPRPCGHACTRGAGPRVLHARCTVPPERYGARTERYVRSGARTERCTHGAVHARSGARTERCTYGVQYLGAVRCTYGARTRSGRSGVLHVRCTRTCPPRLGRVRSGVLCSTAHRVAHGR
jgi:hypothetical protein